MKFPEAINPVTEPVRLVGAIQSVIAAVLFVLSAFDVWTPTDIQYEAILGLYIALTAFVTTPELRRAVTPNVRVPNSDTPPAG